MPEIFTEHVTMVMQTCTCGGVYAITKEFENLARRKGPARPWNCPYCGLQWKFPEAQELRDKRIEELEARLRAEKERSAAAERIRKYYAERNEELHTEKKHLKRQVLGYKGHIAKTRKSLRSGHCPCCGDFLKDLHRHMVRKHPDYEFQPEDIPAPDTK